MNKLKDMPHVTVEQVSRFRDAALLALEQKDKEIAELKSEIENLETALNKFIKAGVCNSTDFHLQLDAMIIAKRLLGML